MHTIEFENKKQRKIVNIRTIFSVILSHAKDHKKTDKFDKLVSEIFLANLTENNIQKIAKAMQALMEAEKEKYLALCVKHAAHNGNFDIVFGLIKVRHSRNKFGKHLDAEEKIIKSLAIEMNASELISLLVYLVKNSHKTVTPRKLQAMIVDELQKQDTDTSIGALKIIIQEDTLLSYELYSVIAFFLCCRMSHQDIDTVLGEAFPMDEEKQRKVVFKAMCHLNKLTFAGEGKHQHGANLFLWLNKQAPEETKKSLLECWKNDYDFFCKCIEVSTLKSEERDALKSMLPADRNDRVPVDLQAPAHAFVDHQAVMVQAPMYVPAVAPQAFIPQPQAQMQTSVSGLRFYLRLGFSDKFMEMPQVSDFPQRVSALSLLYRLRPYYVSDWQQSQNLVGAELLVAFQGSPEYRLCKQQFTYLLDALRKFYDENKSEGKSSLDFQGMLDSLEKALSAPADKLMIYDGVKRDVESIYFAVIDDRNSIEDKLALLERLVKKMPTVCAPARSEHIEECAQYFNSQWLKLFAIARSHVAKICAETFLAQPGMSQAVGNEVHRVNSLMINVAQAFGIEPPKDGLVVQQNQQVFNAFSVFLNDNFSSERFFQDLALEISKRFPLDKGEMPISRYNKLIALLDSLAPDPGLDWFEFFNFSEEKAMLKSHANLVDLLICTLAVRMSVSKYSTQKYSDHTFITAVRLSDKTFYFIPWCTYQPAWPAVFNDDGYQRLSQDMSEDSVAVLIALFAKATPEALFSLNDNWRALIKQMIVARKLTIEKIVRAGKLSPKVIFLLMPFLQSEDLMATLTRQEDWVAVFGLAFDNGKIDDLIALIDVKLKINPFELLVLLPQSKLYLGRNEVTNKIQCELFRHFVNAPVVPGTASTTTLLCMLLYPLTATDAADDDVTNAWKLSCLQLQQQLLASLNEQQALRHYMEMLLLLFDIKSYTDKPNEFPLIYGKINDNSHGASVFPIDEVKLSLIYELIGTHNNTLDDVLAIINRKAISFAMRVKLVVILEDCLQQEKKDSLLPLVGLDYHTIVYLINVFSPIVKDDPSVMEVVLELALRCLPQTNIPLHAAHLAFETAKLRKIVPLDSMSAQALNLRIRLEIERFNDSFRFKPEKFQKYCREIIIPNIWTDYRKMQALGSIPDNATKLRLIVVSLYMFGSLKDFHFEKELSVGQFDQLSDKDLKNFGIFLYKIYEEDVIHEDQMAFLTTMTEIFFQAIQNRDDVKNHMIESFEKMMFQPEQPASCVAMERFFNTIICQCLQMEPLDEVLLRSFLQRQLRFYHEVFYSPKQSPFLDIRILKKTYQLAKEYDVIDAEFDVNIGMALRCLEMGGNDDQYHLKSLAEWRDLLLLEARCSNLSDAEVAIINRMHEWALNVDFLPYFVSSKKYSLPDHLYKIGSRRHFIRNIQLSGDAHLIRCSDVFSALVLSGHDCENIWLSYANNSSDGSYEGPLLPQITSLLSQLQELIIKNNYTFSTNFMNKIRVTAGLKAATRVGSKCLLSQEKNEYLIDFINFLLAVLEDPAHYNVMTERKVCVYHISANRDEGEERPVKRQRTQGDYGHDPKQRSLTDMFKHSAKRKNPSSPVSPLSEQRMKDYPRQPG